MTKVFISYSHDSDAHRERVLDLSDRLRSDGIDCDIDQYNPAPEQGWPRWMMQGIQQADYVLLVCTETYRKRLELEEEQGKGLGVKWEGSLIFNILYRNETFNRKFIPLVFDTENKAHIPDILFGYDYHDLSQPRGYDNLYRHIRGTLGAEKPPLGKARYTRTIYSNSLPTVEGKLFGRKDELTLLDKAWADPQTHVVQFVASGGTGKTKLLKHWLDANTDSIEALIAWSFYSQGSSEDKQISATPFFSHVFGVLKSDKTQFSTEEEKGEHLAHLLRQRRCLLVLDGLEPLQHAGRGMRGELKDRAIRQLLKSLAGEHNSLCIITTRLAVHELSDRAHVISHDLQNLAPDDGVSLLKSWEVHGSETELEKAVHEYGCHALALHLLGNALHTYLEGDVRQRDTLGELIDDYDDAGRHAFKVMQAYSRWLEGTHELQLLHLLGLFDHPIETDVLQVLWQAQVPNLTAGIPEKAWKVAIRDLREKHRMLSAHEGRPDLLDCHPLIREYFGGQLKTQQPQAWQQAHERLYGYYKALPEKEFPDTLEEMQPLFSAVAHGCAAGLHQQALGEVYWPRIMRGEERFSTRTLGAFSDDLTTLAHLFTTPWNTLASTLNDSTQAVVLSWTGFRLRALGRLREALEPMQASVEMRVKQENWKGAAANASNLSELQLTLGDVAQAVESGARSSRYADQSGELFQRMSKLTTHADALHQAGDTAAALALFREAEQLQQEDQPSYPRLYSMPGFRYCDLLLAQGSTAEVLERAEQTLEWMNNDKNSPILTVALDQLTFGRAHLQQAVEDSLHNLPVAVEGQEQATHWLEQAVAGLRIANHHEFLARGLLARAALHRHTRDFTRARQDLQEVSDIADGSGMRLHLTDYHLEMARLLVAEFLTPCPPCGGRVGEGGNSREAADPAYHIAAAAKLINETGYHRRDQELLDLQQALAKESCP
jgi:tetratricopeptide (TPR) repeat protein